MVWVNPVVGFCVSRIWLQGQAASCREQQTLVSLLTLAECHSAAHRADVGVGPRVLSRGTPKSPELT